MSPPSLRLLASLYVQRALPDFGRLYADATDRGWRGATGHHQAQARRHVQHNTRDRANRTKAAAAPATVATDATRSARLERPRPPTRRRTYRRRQATPPWPASSPGARPPSRKAVSRAPSHKPQPPGPRPTAPSCVIRKRRWPAWARRSRSRHDCWVVSECPMADPPPLPRLTHPKSSRTTVVNVWNSRSGRPRRCWAQNSRPLDHYPVRVRLPDEPLMLVDRILRVDGVKGSMGWRPGRDRA